MTTECNRLVSDFVPKSDARCGRRFHGGSDQLGEIRASAEGIRGEKEKRRVPLEIKAEKLRAQHAVKRVAPSKSSRKVSGFRINPATQQPCGQSRLPN
jgi:hypothetical protein